MLNVIANYLESKILKIKDCLAGTRKLVTLLLIYGSQQ